MKAKLLFTSFLFLLFGEYVIHTLIIEWGLKEEGNVLSEMVNMLYALPFIWSLMLITILFKVIKSKENDSSQAEHINEEIGSLDK